MISKRVVILRGGCFCENYSIGAELLLCCVNFIIVSVMHNVKSHTILTNVLSLAQLTGNTNYII